MVNPKRTIPFAASRVNNITDDMVSDAPFFDEVLRHFLEFVGEDVLVGHNIQSFDMKFIYRDCERYFHQLITNDYVDTLILAKRCFTVSNHEKTVRKIQIVGCFIRKLFLTLQEPMS